MEFSPSGASHRSEGKAFRDADAWRLPHRLPEDVARRTVEAATPGRAPRLVFSGLDSSVAGEIEAAFAHAGHIIVSNSRNYRMEATVPLMIPEINADHLALLDAQEAACGWKGRILTNPNCATVVLAMALAPLRQFGLKTTIVTTLQAISGAGYPGVPSWDILGNTFHIGGGEEERSKPKPEDSQHLVERNVDSFRRVSATTTRVPVQNGHGIDLGRARTAADGEAIIDAWTTFKGRPQTLELPSAPSQPIVPSRKRTGPSRSSTSTATAARRSCGPAPAVSAVRLQVRRAWTRHHSQRRGLRFRAELMHREGLL